MPRIHGNVIAWVKPSSQWETDEWEKAETMIKKDILRWADDGGRMLDQRNRMARSNAKAARKQVNEPNNEPQRQRKLSRIVSGNNDSTSHVS